MENGAPRQLQHQPGLSPGRKNQMVVSVAGTKCAMHWDTENSNALWIGRRERAQRRAGEGPLHPGRRHPAASSATPAATSRASRTPSSRTSSRSTPAMAPDAGALRTTPPLPTASARCCCARRSCRAPKSAAGSAWRIDEAAQSAPGKISKKGSLFCFAKHRFTKWLMTGRTALPCQLIGGIVPWPTSVLWPTGPVRGLLDGIRASQQCGAAGVQLYAWNELDPRTAAAGRLAREQQHRAFGACAQEVTALCARARRPRL